MRNWFKLFLSVALVAVCALCSQTEARAQSYDMSWMDSKQPASRLNATYSNRDTQFNLSSLGMQKTTIANVSRPTSTQSVKLPTNRRVPLQTVQTSTLAQYSVDNAPIKSGSFHYGFPNSGSKLYRGAYAQTYSQIGGSLPPVSTSSVDINICDEGGMGPGAGGPPGSGTGGGDGSGSQAPPALPPGWTGVMCHGIYAGAIPPGGTVEAFWRGEYGFAGDAAQQAALLEEGKWLLANGQIGP